jgi:hypothetical protein
MGLLKPRLRLDFQGAQPVEAEPSAEFRSALAAALFAGAAVFFQRC